LYKLVIQFHTKDRIHGSWERKLVYAQNVRTLNHGQREGGDRGRSNKLGEGHQGTGKEGGLIIISKKGKNSLLLGSREETSKITKEEGTIKQNSKKKISPEKKGTSLNSSCGGSCRQRGRCQRTSGGGKKKKKGWKVRKRRPTVVTPGKESRVHRRSNGGKGTTLGLQVLGGRGHGNLSKTTHNSKEKKIRGPSTARRGKKPNA